MSAATWAQHGTKLYQFSNSLSNKINNVRITQHWGTFTKSLLPWIEINITYFCVCVRARVCGWGCKCTGAGVCLRSWCLTNPLCNAHSPYCHPRPLWFHHTFRHYKDFRKKKDTARKMRILISSTNFILNISHSKKNSARYCYKCENVYM